MRNLVNRISFSYDKFRTGSFIFRAQNFAYLIFVFRTPRAKFRWLNIFFHFSCAKISPNTCLSQKVKMHDSKSASDDFFYRNDFHFKYPTCQDLSLCCQYGKSPFTSDCHTVAQFITLTDVLPQDLVQSRNREIKVYAFPIALKFDRHVGSSIAEMPVKF